MKLILHYIYWTLVFTPGLMDLIGLHSGIYRVGLPLVGTLLFFMTLVQSKPTVKLPFVLPVCAFIAISIASSLYNDQPLYNWAFFLLFTLLVSYLYFLIIANERDEKLVSRVGKLVVVLILLQIPAVLIKYLILGQSEDGAIGTLSVKGGSISTVFPLLVVAFLTSFYFYTRKKIYLLLILMFALFGIIGGKRAIVFFLPAEIFVGYVLYIMYNKTEITRKMAANAVIVVLISGLLVALTVKTVPTLNPERSNWGSIDLAYVLNYTEDYTSTGYFEGNPDATLEEIRRTEGLRYFLALLMDYDYANMMLGDGAGNLVKSAYSEDSGEMIDVYGVRYGGRMGFIWLLMQVGILGVVVHLILHVQLLWRVHGMRIVADRYYEALRLGFVLASAFLFLDFIIYSVISIQTEAVKGVYFFAAAILYRRAYAQRMSVWLSQQRPVLIYARN